MSETRRVAVVGSGLTRAALLADARFQVPAGHYFARTSLAALATPAAADVLDLGAISTDFRRALVRRDVERRLVEDIVALDPGAIVIDALEERLGVVRLHDGRVITRSPEAAEAGLGSLGGEVLSCGQKGHSELWSAGWSSFVQGLQEAGMWDRVVLHAAQMLTSDELGNPASSAPALEGTNSRLAGLYERMRYDVPAEAIVEVSADLNVAPTEGGKVAPLKLAATGAAHLADKVWEAMNLARHAPDDRSAAVQRPAPRHADRASTAFTTERQGVVPSSYGGYGVDVVSWESSAAFAEAPVQAGLHRMGLPDGNHLDLIVRGDLGSIQAQESVVVFLSGAMSKRNGSAPPFFAGRRVSQKLGIPWVAVSDPGMQLSHEILLAWYTGAPGSDAVPATVQALRSISAELDRDLLLVGGSGGGFAALRLAEELGDRASALVWNPQTDILEYEPAAVTRYLATIIPEGTPDHVDDRVGAEAKLAAAGVQHRVETMASGARVLILQNASDHHVHRHLLPLLARSGARERDRDLIAVDDSHVARILSWGKGHAVLPVEVTCLAVDAMRRGEGVAKTVARVEEALGAPHAQGLSEAASGGIAEGVAVEPAGAGRVRVSWDLSIVGPSSACTADFAREEGARTVASVENVVSPLIVEGLGEGELWRLDLRDASGRLVGAVRFDARAKKREVEVTPAGRRSYGRKQR